MSASKGQIGFLLSVMLCLALPARAENRLQAPNWDRELALQTASMGQDEPKLKTWYGMLRSGSRAELLGVIEDYSASRQVSAPVREKQLFLFTQGLADFPAAMIPAALLEFLEAYTPQTLVPHAEDDSVAVPLFNIPAAAQGVRHGIDRQRGEIRSAQLLEAEPDAWIQGYLAASRPARAGFLEALNGASAEQMELLKQSTAQALHRQPELFVVAATLAQASGDRAALDDLVRQGGGAEVAPMLRSAAVQLSEHDQALLLFAAIESAPAENAALAIALLAPGLHATPEVTDSLFDLLGDPALGSAAALALSRHPDPEVVARLGSLAEGVGSVAGRARLALDLASGGTGE